MSSIRKRTWKNGDKTKTAFQLNVTIAGKRVQKQFPKKSEAEAYLGKLLASQPLANKDNDQITFSDIADEWIKTCEVIGREGRPPVERSTLESYRGHVKNHLKPIVGETTKIADITPGFCKRVRDELVSKNSRSNAKKILGSFSAIMNEALLNEWVNVNPVSQVKVHLDKREKQAPVVPTKAEAKAILKKCRSRAETPSRYQLSHRRYYTLVALGFFTGLRMSELRGLAWNNISSDFRTITVEQRADNFGEIGKLKSHAAYRIVRLGNELSRILLEWWDVAPPGDSLALVFPSKTGKPMNYQNIYNRGWKPALKAAEISRHLTPHGMRHFHASHLIEMGRTPKAVQVAMGHEDIQTTFNIYGHLFPDSESTPDPDELYRDLL